MGTSTYSGTAESGQQPITPADMQKAVRSAQWRAFDDVLNYLNTLETKTVAKKDVFAAVMELRPRERPDDEVQNAIDICIELMKQEAPTTRSRMVLAIAAHSIRRGRLLTPEEKLENLKRTLFGDATK